MAKAVLVFRDAAVEKQRLERLSAEQREQAQAQQTSTEEERRRNAEAQTAAAKGGGAVAGWPRGSRDSPKATSRRGSPKAYAGL